jgi:predicted DNA-binding antitoxin AbrB/MazE fold protein
MSYQVDAIFANGVLTPLQPLALPEESRVKLTVEPQTETDEPQAIAAQQAAIETLFMALDGVPQHRNNDGWSAQRHDELLYGAKK